jgi:hypothetical protein
MLIVKIIGDGYEYLIETIIACFVATNQQNRGAERIEGVEHPDGLSAALNPQFAHMAMARTLDPRRLGKAKPNITRFKQIDRCRHIDLFRVAQM